MSLAEGYERRWDITSLEGKQGELFTKWARDAIRDGDSVEVKTDLESWRTGNIYIEFECFISDEWVPSGVDERHTQSVVWAHLVVGPMVLFAPTEYVRWVASKYGKDRECTRSSNPTRGKVLPIQQFIALIVAIAGDRVAPQDTPPALDSKAPFGRYADGSPVTIFGLNKDGSVRRNPGGPRAGEREPSGFWPAKDGIA